MQEINFRNRGLRKRNGLPKAIKIMACFSLVYNFAATHSTLVTDNRDFD